MRQIENLIEDRPKKQELCEVGDFQCTRCFFKPLRYDQLVGHMRNECARRDVHCRYCDRTHAADYVESCINNPDAAAINKQKAKLEREVQLYKDQMEDAQKTANEANMRIEAVRQREDILQTRLNQQTLKLRREEAIKNQLIRQQQQQQVANPPPANDRIVPRPKRYGQDIGTNFVRQKLLWQNGVKKMTIGWIENRLGNPIPPEKREVMINREDTVRSVRDKIRALCKINWPRQLFYNGINGENTKLVNNIDPIKEVDDITTGADGILWIGRSNIWDDDEDNYYKDCLPYRY